MSTQDYNNHVIIYIEELKSFDTKIVNSYGNLFVRVETEEGEIGAIIWGKKVHH